MTTVEVVSAGPSALAEIECLLGGTRYRIHMEPAWLSAYVAEFHVAESARILLVREKGTGLAIGALPLQEQLVRGTRWWNIRRLVPLGSGPSDFVDILAAPGRVSEVCRALALWLRMNRDAWDECVLDLLPESSSSWRPLVTELRAAGMAPSVSQERRFFKVDTTGAWNTYETDVLRRNDKVYNKLSNRVKHANIRVDCDVIVSGVGARFRELVDLYQRRRNSKGQRDTFKLHPSMKDFILRVIDEFEERKWVRLSILRGNGAIWAFQLDWFQSGVWYGYMPAFDEEFRYFSPGRLLLREMLRIAFADPDVHEFNFMRGESPYKQLFTQDSERFIRIIVTNSKSLRLAGTRAAARVASVRDRVLGGRLLASARSRSRSQL